MLSSGEFHSLSGDFQRRLIRRLKLLYSRLTRSLGNQKLKWAGTVMALVLSAAVARAGYNDPQRLSGFVSPRVANPTQVDLDDDGDLDLVIGSYNSGLSHIENLGDSYKERTGDSYPIDTITVESYSTPAFADLDDDGDQDLLVGNFNGTFQYFENDGGVYTEQLGTANPFDGIDIGAASDPAFVDLDDDGDMDVVVGELYGTIKYFENDGGSFSELTGTDNPFDGIDVGTRSAPGFVDYDNDGDLDLYIGEKYGTVFYFENDGGTFTELTGTDNPFDGIDIDQITSPLVFDADRDSDLDLVIGDNESERLRFFENDGGTHTEQRGTMNPFEGVIVGSNLHPVFLDFDGDSDIDLIAGAGDGSVMYWERTDGELIPAEGVDNPFDVIDAVSTAAPALVDLDDDGDLDVVVGSYYGTIQYYLNDNGTYVERTGLDNPFDGIDVGYNSSPELVDWDDDGDFDLFVGEKYGEIAYYENQAGTYVQQTGTDNPADGLETSTFISGITFFDIDEDGDLDLFVGEKYGSILSYENDGGVLTALTGSDNPLDGIQFESIALPAFTDFDSDGDTDLMVGENSGDLLFLPYSDPGINVNTGSGLTTTEAGGTALFTVVLESKPTSDVTINMTSSDTDEGVLDAASLVFTSSNWDTPQTVTITGVDDTEEDGDQDYSISFSVSSSDADYDGMSIADLTVTNTDDDSPSGIDPITLQDIDVYAFEKTVIIDAGDLNLDKVTIYNMIGRQVSSKIIESTGRIEIPMYDANSGIYIVKVFSNGEVSTAKVYID
jgi:hypothetical protein